MSSETLDVRPLGGEGVELALQRLSLDMTRLAAHTNGDTSNHDSSATERLEASSPKGRKATMDFVGDFKGAAQQMTDGPLNIESSELRIRELSAQADISQSHYECLGLAEWIEKAIECQEEVLSLIPDGHATRPYQTTRLGILFYQRFERLSNIADLEKAIQCLSQSILLTPDTDPSKPALHNNIGNTYNCRFESLGELTDPDKAIEYQTQGLQLAPDGHQLKPTLLANLGNSCLDRFEHLGKRADLDKATECHTQALQLTPDGHPDQPGMVNDLGNSYLRRFEHLDELEALDKAIEFHAQAIQLTPDGHPDKPIRLHNLGISYVDRFERFSELSDLNYAIQQHTQALQPTPDDHPDKPGRLNSLGTSYAHRLGRLSELADIDYEIDCQTQAVQLTPDGHSYKPTWLTSLGNAYTRRFSRLGKLSDVDQGIECQIKALQLTLDGHPDKPSRPSNLGISYFDRSQRLGDISDLGKAMKCQTQAVRLTPDGHPHKPIWLTNLRNSYLCRFERRGKPADLLKGTECHAQAVQLRPDDHPDKPKGLNNLGSSYMHRFKHLGELSDLEKAIECQTRVVHLTPDCHPDKPRWLGNLGNSYQCQFKHLDKLVDADKGIECHAQAVQLIPDGHLSKPMRLNINLGNSHLDRFKVLSDRADLKRAQTTFQQVAQHAVTDPETQLACARSWAKTSFGLGLSPNQAYQRCMELVPRLVWLGSTINHRYKLLINVDNLATEAACWAISTQSYDLALEWLEEGRSIVWNQILQLRTPFDDLLTVDASLAQCLKHIASQLEDAGSRTTHDFSIYEESGLEKDAQHHHHLAAEWDECLEKARRIPGFHNFMRPRKAEELKLAASDGPVVFINTHSHAHDHSTRCDTLIIFPHCDDIVHVPLPDFVLEETDPVRTERDIMAQQRRDPDRGLRLGRRHRPDDSLKAILATIWSNVVEPILDALGCTSDDSSPNAFDLVVSSYTPTLSALLTPKAPAPQMDPGILAVGQEDAQGLSQLPCTAQELAAIKQQATATRFLLIDGGNATVDAVLNAMNQYSWVHLACHAAQNSVNPAQSAFRLHDGNLTLEAVTKRSFKNKGLAFLSACYTARGDDKMPDEAVHLAAGMLMAGYPSVIAAMWSIADLDGPEVARTVYAELLKDGKMDYKGAARALHKAIGELREKVGKDSFERWVPFIHIGV